MTKRAKRRRSRGRWQYYYLFVGACFMLMSLGSAIGVAQTERAARSWPTTTAQVLESRVERGSGRTPSYHPVIRYRYEVGGVIYHGSTIWVAQGSGYQGESDAQAFAADYPVGKQVRVHYDPADPATAALFVTGSHWNIIVMAVLGLVIASIGFPSRRGD